MNHRMRINRQRNGSPLGRPGMCRRTRSLHVAREARAPPAARAITTQDGTVITMHEWPPQRGRATGGNNESESQRSSNK